MKDTRIAVAQFSPRLGDLEHNRQTHERLIGDAAAAGAELVVFPELSLTGYHLGDQVPDVALAVDSEPLRRLAETSRQVDVVVGFVEDGPGHRFHNAAAYFSEGRLLHVHRKLYLPTYGMFQEGREFAAGEFLRSFDTSHGPVGLLICEDLWHPTSAWLLAQQGAEIVITVGNGPTRGTRTGAGITSIEIWRRLLQTNAQFQTAYFVFANRVGCEDGLTFGGGSMVVDPFGEVLREWPALDEELATCEISADALRRARAIYPLLRDADLDLVARELDRLMRTRYRLPGDEQDATPGDPEQSSTR
jgi:predicted amidohydrolase